MLVGVLISSLILFTLQPSDCPDAPSCRQAALDAAARGEFETFHDLAWRAAQKGKRNDPDLMLLLARAQSLSGRPGDALVMLRRLAQMRVAVDATGEDFRRVRALPGWPEVETLLKEGASARPAAPAPEPARSTPEAGGAALRKGDVPDGVVPKATAPKSPGRKAGAPAVKAPASASPPTAPAARDDRTAAAPGTGDTDDEALPAALGSLRPAGIAYDGVSRRFIIGDRADNKLVIFDAVFKQATDMTAAASAGFFGLSAVEIDHRRGDLWVANSGGGRPSALHKLQLVSGRVLFELPVPESFGATSFVDAAVLADGHVLLLDAAGRRLLAVAPGARTFHRLAAADADGLESIAIVNGTAVYAAHARGLLRIDLGSRAVSGVRGAPAGLRRVRGDGRSIIGVQASDGGHRVVRLRFDANGRRVTAVEVLDKAVQLPHPSALTVTNEGIFYITLIEGAPAIRHLKPRR